MTTVVNNPAPAAEGNSTGMVIGLIILAAVIFLLLVFGVPYFRNSSTPEGGGDASITVPDQIDVNINPGGAPAQ